MKYFEYLHDILIAYETEGDSFQIQLNKKGSEGWELISVISQKEDRYDTGEPLYYGEPVYAQMTEYQCVFKREVEYEIKLG